MGCVVSSAFLEEDDQRRRRIISAHHHHQHIVSLTSSTYGILTAPRAYSSSSTEDTSSPPAADAVLAAPPPPPPLPPSTTQQQCPTAPEEVINSWELMAGLHDPCTPAKPCSRVSNRPPYPGSRIPLSSAAKPPGEEEEEEEAAAAVLYTTSLRGVRATFEACNAVRAALQAHGVAFRERDVSMDRAFRDQLQRRLLQLQVVHDDEHTNAGGLPRLFVRGRHVGGADEVLRLDEQGALAPLLEGLPRAATPPPGGCDGCGGMRFLPCFDCSGSRKLAVPLPHNNNTSKKKKQRWLLLRCRECNENGLVLCPICS